MYPILSYVMYQNWKEKNQQKTEQMSLSVKAHGLKIQSRGYGRFSKNSCYGVYDVVINYKGKTLFVFYCTFFNNVFGGPGGRPCFIPSYPQLHLMCASTRQSDEQERHREKPKRGVKERSLNKCLRLRFWTLEIC